MSEANSGARSVAKRSDETKVVSFMGGGGVNLLHLSLSPSDRTYVRLQDRNFGRPGEKIIMLKLTKKLYRI